MAKRAKRNTVEDSFQRLYEENWNAILSYALRRTQRSEDAADIVAETFLVAWRRFDDVPSGESGRAWLYGVARRTLANQRRGEHRRDRLAERLRNELSTASPAENRGRMEESASPA
jgi:RNA polymerase sigma factor (sigma-70 family)